jgi:uncharacterized 2Fe-2S/4Fe-4S cluster protein (DUF4445 family)
MLLRVNVEIRFSPSGRRVRVPEGTNLLEAIRRAGLPVASACGADGTCGRCGVRILVGGEGLAESHAESDVRRRNRVASGLRLACRVAARRDLEVTASYW